jgi:hypothetical protein
MELACDQGQSYAQMAQVFGIKRMSVWRRLKSFIAERASMNSRCLFAGKSHLITDNGSFTLSALAKY